MIVYVTKPGYHDFLAEGINRGRVYFSEPVPYEGYVDCLTDEWVWPSFNSHSDYGVRVKEFLKSFNKSDKEILGNHIFDLYAATIKVPDSEDWFRDIDNVTIETSQIFNKDNPAPSDHKEYILYQYQHDLVIEQAISHEGQDSFKWVARIDVFDVLNLSR